MSNNVPSIVEEAVLKPTVKDPQFDLHNKVRGYDFSNGVNYHDVLKTYLNSGFQATNFALAVAEINKMIACRELPLEEPPYVDTDDPFSTVRHNCTIFLGYTSNIVSSGLREVVRFLVQHNLVGAQMLSLLRFAIIYSLDRLIVS